MAGSSTDAKANTARGRPMLPELLNITGGTRVRVWNPMRRPTGQASSPEPSTTTAAPRAGISRSVPAVTFSESTKNTRAGVNSTTLMRLAVVMSAARRRPYRKPISTMPNTGTMISRTRSMGTSPWQRRRSIAAEVRGREFQRRESAAVPLWFGPYFSHR